MQTTQSNSSKPSALPLLAGTLVTLGIVGFIGWGIWQALHPAPVPLQGMVDATAVSVAAKIPGRLEALTVHEGDMVKVGDTVATIGIPEIEAKLAQVKAQREQAEAKNDMAQTGPREEEKRAAAADLARAQAGLTLAKKSYDRVNALFKEGLIAAQKHDEALAQYNAARELVVAAGAKVDALNRGAREEEKAATKAMVAQATGGVDEVTSLANEGNVKSPVAGEVTRVVMQVGEVTPAGFPIVVVTDLDNAWVTFNVREDELAQFKKGTKFDVTIPALKQNATLFVTWINPRGAYATWRATKQTSGYDLRTFEVRAKPTAPIADLRPGMTVVYERH